MQRISTPLVAMLTLLFLSFSLQAVEVAGVEMPDHLRAFDKKTRLMLNGAGVRKKFFFKIYAAGLYLTARAHSTEEVLSLDGPKKVRMVFIYSEVDKEKLTDGWEDGFENNLSHEENEFIQPRLKRFNKLFTTVRKGDVIDLDFIPGRGTLVTIKGSFKGEIEGDDFYKALLKVWLGKKPADKGLKKALLDK